MKTWIESPALAFDIPEDSPRDEKGRKIDPTSKLPIGSIIENSRGKFGMVLYKKILLITKDQAERIMAGAGSQSETLREVSK